MYIKEEMELFTSKKGKERIQNARLLTLSCYEYHYNEHFITRLVGMNLK